jgi:hypothetical protein
MGRNRFERIEEAGRNNSNLAQGVASETRPDLSTPRASAESMSVTRDEDRNPRRGGSLERDQPTSPPIETLKRLRLACFGTPPGSAGGETRSKDPLRCLQRTGQWARQGEEGETPGGLKIPGEDRLPSCGVTPADRSTDSRYGLKPLKASPQPAASLRSATQPLPRERGRWPSGHADTEGLGPPPATTSETTARLRRSTRNATRGRGVDETTPAIGRETL